MRLEVLLADCWSLLLLAAFIVIQVRVPRVPQPRRSMLLVVAGVALLARLVPHILLPIGAGFDIESYRIVGDLVLDGQPVYSNPAVEGRHPYLPLVMYAFAGARWIAERLDLPFLSIIRLLPISVDSAIAIVLAWVLARRYTPLAGWRGGLLYALNPISVFVASFHGQFDALPVLALLLAVIVVETAPFAAGLWLGLGILLKSWPVLGLPILVWAVKPWRARLFLVGALLLVPLLGVLIYLFWSGDPFGLVLRRALGYNAGVGVYGYLIFTRIAAAIDPRNLWMLVLAVDYGRWITLVALGAVWLLRARHEPPAAGMLTVLVTFFAVTHAFAIQYLMWLVPFALLEREQRWLTAYTIAAYVYMLLVYTTFIFEPILISLGPRTQVDAFIVMPTTLPIWLISLAWWIQRLRRHPQDMVQY
jgi:hypothetical protein